MLSYIDCFFFILGVNNKPEEKIVDESLKKLQSNAVSIEILKKPSVDIEKSQAEKVAVKIESSPGELSIIKRAELKAMEIEQEKKRKALEEAKKLLGPSNSIEIVPIKRGRKPEEPAPVPIRMPTHEPIVSNVEALIHNDESNDELSEPPSVTLPVFEELANKNGGTGIRRKIGKGKLHLSSYIDSLNAC